MLKRITVGARRAAAMGSVACALALAAACESSSSVTTAPTPARCGLEAQASAASFSADGGTGTLRIATNRECGWSASTNAEWITLPSPAQGQGEGVMQFSVAPHPDPAARTADIVVQERRLQVSQEGRACEFRLSSTSELLPSSGGQGRVDVVASSPQCRWTATSGAPWITIVAGQDVSGSGAAMFQVGAMAGAPRGGALTIAGHEVRVTQGAACIYAVSPASLQLGTAGGRFEITVTAPAGCPWSTEAPPAWVAVTGGAGEGTGVMAVTISPSTGPERSTSIRIAGQEIALQQGSGCGVTLSPTPATVGSAGGPVSIAVTTSAGCAWSSSASAPWIGVTSGGSGIGPGRVELAAGANAGPARTGSVSIGGAVVSVQQGSGCTVGVTPGASSVAAAGARVTLQLDAAAGCVWSAASPVPWITVTSAASGSGAGAVELTVAPNIGPARTEALVVGGKAIAVTQASGCAYAVSPVVHEVPAAGLAGTLSVATAPGCAWTAASSVDWITVPPQGSGPGAVQLVAARNAGPPRTGTLTLAGQVVTVNQASACSFQLAPPSHAFDAGGGSGNVLVVVSGPCAWSAVASAEWIVISTGASGANNGLVQFTVPPNAGPARTATMTIAGQSYSVTQAGR